MHTSQCSYLTLFLLNVIIYLPSTTLNLDFFRKVDRNQTSRAHIRLTLSSNSLYTTACLVPGSRLSVSYPISTFTIWTTILLIKAVEVISLSKYFHISGIVSIFKDYPYVLQQKPYLSTVSGPCITRTDLVSIYLPICCVAVHY
jgi:hypothetical protein